MTKRMSVTRQYVIPTIACLLFTGGMLVLWAFLYPLVTNAWRKILFTWTTWGLTFVGTYAILSILAKRPRNDSRST